MEIARVALLNLRYIRTLPVRVCHPFKIDEFDNAAGKNLSDDGLLSRDGDREVATSTSFRMQF